MKQIRPGLYQVSYAELGSPKRKGAYELAGMGKVVLDEADINYAMNCHDPLFVIRETPVLGKGIFGVISRQRTARLAGES